MNTAIELHDSRVIGITPSDSSVIVRFRPAYVHRSDGRPGFDPGSGWVQDCDLVVSEAVLESNFPVMPWVLDDGWLSFDDEVFENLMPLPLDVRGAVQFSARGLNGERQDILGTRATVSAVGEARYVELFPGTK